MTVRAYADPNESNPYEVELSRHNREPILSRPIAKELAIDKLVRLILEEQERKSPLKPSPGTLQREHSFCVSLDELEE